nr:ribosomal protein S19 [Dracaena serrulata]UDP58731.1 ribosomal protein S19 [Dracaena serrulata]
MTRSLKKKSFCSKSFIEKNGKTQHEGGERNNSNLVSGIYDYTQNDWPYNRCSKWKRTFTYLYNRSYGRSQIGRIRTYSDFRKTCEKRKYISS